MGVVRVLSCQIAICGRKSFHDSATLGGTWASHENGETATIWDNDKDGPFFRLFFGLLLSSLMAPWPDHQACFGTSKDGGQSHAVG